MLRPIFPLIPQEIGMGVLFFHNDLLLHLGISINHLDFSLMDYMIADQPYRP